MVSMLHENEERTCSASGDFGSYGTFAGSCTADPDVRRAACLSITARLFGSDLPPFIIPLLLQKAGRAVASVKLFQRLTPIYTHFQSTSPHPCRHRCLARSRLGNLQSNVCAVTKAPTPEPPPHTQLIFLTWPRKGVYLVWRNRSSRGTPAFARRTIAAPVPASK